jgi:23S rRNA-/tRNA-specific pseudouridylate synthase
VALARAVKRPPPLSAEQIQARVLHRDGLILVIDKPAGVAVHGGSGMSFGVIEALRASRPRDSGSKRSAGATRAFSATSPSRRARLWDARSICKRESK